MAAIAAGLMFAGVGIFGAPLIAISGMFGAFLGLLSAIL